MPTSGMPMPACWAKRCTTPTIQASSALLGWLMMRTPILILAIGLLIKSEMIAPPKPMMKANTSSEPRLRPLAVRNRFTPSKLAVIPSTATTATLVNKNKAIRFIVAQKKRQKNKPLWPYLGRTRKFSSTAGGTEDQGVIVETKVRILRTPARNSQHGQRKKWFFGQRLRLQGASQCSIAQCCVFRSTGRAVDMRRDRFAGLHQLFQQGMAHDQQLRL